MLIQFDHVTRQFDSHKAVDDVSFGIDQGEIVGLLGHNGAGKTTIMKLLTGYLEPTCGEIIVNGQSMGRDTQLIQASMGYLPENCPLWPNMSIIEFLTYQASLKNITAAQRQDYILRAIERTHLREKATQAIRTLSKGYRQRVGVANAILSNPKIIILDEPTNGLDPTQTLHMRALIRELAQTSTIILSTHILQEVEAVCDRVIIVRLGKIVTDKKLSELDQPTGLQITVDQNEHKIRALLESLAGVRAITFKNARDGQFQYMLDADLSLAASISRTVLSAGYQLFEMSTRRQTLETLFKEDFTT